MRRGIASISSSELVSAAFVLAYQHIPPFTSCSTDRVDTDKMRSAFREQQQGFPAVVLHSNF